MQFSITFLAVLAACVVATPLPQNGRNGGGNGGGLSKSVIEQLQATFDRNNPNGTPTNPGNPDDLNGDGVINVFEAGAQAA